MELKRFRSSVTRDGVYLQRGDGCASCMKPSSPDRDVKICNPGKIYVVTDITTDQEGNTIKHVVTTFTDEFQAHLAFSQAVQRVKARDAMVKPDDGDIKITTDISSLISKAMGLDSPKPH